MAHLDRLTISKRIIDAAKPRHTAETAEYRRRKLIANVEEQIELANLVLADKAARLQRKRGHRVVDVRPRLWWKRDPNGEVFTQIRYNKIALNLAGRGTSIEVGSLHKLPHIYRTVIKAIAAGELDRAIESAVRKSRR